MMEHDMGRRYGARNRRSIVAVSILLLLFGNADCATAGETWEVQLQQQLRSEKNCELSYLTNAKAYRRDGRDVVEARAHCADGSAYDVIRRDKPLKFEINACGLQVC
jgi:hypothetical protein